MSTIKAVRTRLYALFCKEHLDKASEYANPIFENQLSWSSLDKCFQSPTCKSQRQTHHIFGIINNIVNINHLVKDHKTGGLPVSNKLLAMLNILPHDSARVFSYRYSQVSNAFELLKRRVVAGTNNERFNYIELRTFRHWGGTKLDEMSNGNVLTVMKLLRHKSVTSALKYIDIYKLSFTTETEFEFLAVGTPEELKVALLGGYTLVIEKFGVSWFRLTKRIAFAITPIIQRKPRSPSAENEDSFNKEKPAIRNAY